MSDRPDDPTLDSDSRELFEGSALPAAEFSLDRLRRLRDQGADEDRYQDVGIVGAGGMGVVHEVQDGNLRRRLAMKRLRHQDPLSLESEEELPAHQVRRLARFLEEAQVTSQLDHPGIVPVHELGIDGGGQVYYTMKLVRGMRLSEVVAAHHAGEADWSMARCLGLILKACEAVAYAHDKGVLHRDLKPQNVMVGRYGEVFVMDWGLAHVIGSDVDTASGGSTIGIVTDRHRDRRASDSPVGSLEGGAAGTPHYMSPEQAAGSVDLTPASDVYSMGSVLYELLTGRAPYADTEREAEADRSDAIKRSVLAGPPAPVARLVPGAPGELVAICERAMAREPGERYLSVVELARELRDYVEGRVVRSYEAGAWAELRKWTRRNRGLAAGLVATVLVALTGTVAVAAVQSNARQALETKNAELGEARDGLARSVAALREAKGLAEEQAAEARRQRDVSEEVVGFLQTVFRVPSPREYRGHELTVGTVLATATRLVRARFAESPEVQARLMQVLGDVHGSTADWETARALLTDSYETFLALRGKEDASTLSVARDLADACMELEDYREAERILRETIAIQERLLGPDDRETLRTRHDLAYTLEVEERIEEAVEVYEDVLARQRRGLGPDDESLFQTMANFGDLLSGEGQVDRAEQLLLEALEGERRLFGDRDVETAGTQFYLAWLYLETERYEEARDLLLEVRAIEAEILGEDHPDTALTNYHLSEALEGLEDYEGALGLLRETWESERSFLGPEHESTLLTRRQMGRLLNELERHEEALAVLREVQRAEAGSPPTDPADALSTDFHVAYTLEMLGRVGEAEQLYRATLATQRALAGPTDPDTLDTLLYLADLLEGEDRDGEAEGLYREAIAALRADDPVDPNAGTDERLLRPLESLAELLLRTGRAEEALPLARECLEGVPEDDAWHADYVDLVARIEEAIRG